MKQKSTAQIREELRKDMAKMFEKKYKYLNDDIERYKQAHKEANERFKKYYKKCSELEEENTQLKEKINQYEDWVERLQEFMDIKDTSERKQAFETYIKEKQSRVEFNTLLDIYNEMFNRLFAF